MAFNNADTVYLKIVIIGDGACGKSALLLAYTKREFSDSYTPTVVDSYDVLLGLGDGRNLKLTVVDTAGQEEFKNIRALNYGGSHVVIVCYSCESKITLNNVRSSWVPEIRAVDRRTRFVLVGNKMDKAVQGDPNSVTEKEAAYMCRKLDGYASIQCSAKQFAMSRGTFGNVDAVFKAAIKCGLVSKGVIESDNFCDKCMIL